jgi:hypothetical protein
MATQWEYQIEVVDLDDRDHPPEAAVAQLARQGLDGWEAVSMSPSHAAGRGLRVETTQYVVLLKRPKRRG